MRELKSCGVICFRENGHEFLLLRHPKRWDVAKGHQRKTETEQECARRELLEETAIRPDQTRFDSTFRFTTSNKVRFPYGSGPLVDKEYVIFLAYVWEPLDIQLSFEHERYEWFAWNPPHKIQRWLIDPLLKAVEVHFREHQIRG
jgi:bis(5'-nucleosidyl)-tetraphosphatase